MPSDLQFVDDVFNKIVPIPKGKANAGDLAEDLIVDTALTVLNIAFPQFTNFVWREPEIAYDGEPLYNGKNYGQPLDAPNVFQSGQRGTKPDYVISKYKPVDEVKGSLTQKSYLIGDFKITPKAALDYVKGRSNRATKPKNQWLSMRGYAKKHQYTPLTNFITFYDNPTQIRLTKKIALKRDKVILFVIPLTYKQTK